MIDLDRVAFRYADMEMSFTLHVPRGTMMAVVGPSGGGKSTMLSLIAGFETPLSGRVRIDGLDMNGIAPAQRPVSVIFQGHNVFAHLDIFTNVALGISPALRLSGDDRARVLAALARVGLQGMESRKPGEVSGGERQRVAIARALVRDKPVLLLDEPFAALGPALRRDMLNLVMALKAERSMTILMVTHQPEDALYAADQTAFIARGSVLAVGETKALLKSPVHAEVSAYLE